MTWRAALAVVLLIPARAFPQESVPASRPTTRPGLAWAEVLDGKPDPQVVKDASHREAMAMTGLPWRVRDKGSGIELVLIPPGKFMMGASDGDTLAKVDEFPQHPVTISKPFYMGRYEVTEGQWKTVMQPAWNKEKDYDHNLRHGDRYPLDDVSWSDTRDFAEKAGFRLPTESEWEYACRAGTRGVFYGDIDAIAWHRKNSGVHLHEVGGRLANDFGLHDMIGNASEWCSDWDCDAPYDDRVDGVTDPQGPRFGQRKCFRGAGAWDAPDRQRPSLRGSWEPDSDVCGSGNGFRVCRHP